MGYIFCLMGKSSSGKDTVYQRLLRQKDLGLQRLVTGTTRPIREGEQNGETYYFYTDEQFEQLCADGKIIESRSYHTVHGIWHYFTVADEQLDPARGDYLTINTLEAYLKLRDHFGSERLIPLYLEVDDGLRLQRALERERRQTEPKYKELCRRFLADEEDFSGEKLRALEITDGIDNTDLSVALEQIRSLLKKGR